MSSPARCRGVTLVELIVTIVVVAVAVSGVLALVSGTAARSAENMQQVQAVAIAESYLNEILQKPFGVDPCAPGCTRIQMAKVGDYNLLADVGARDATGTAVTNLTGYTVRVAVTNPTLGTAPVVPTTQSELVTVTVTSPDNQAVALSGFRTLYPP